MLPFKSIFSSEKNVIDDELFPKLPNIREIEEDLENSNKNDPVFGLARLLQDIVNSTDSSPSSSTTGTKISPTGTIPEGSDSTSTEPDSESKDFELLPKSLVINSFKDATSKIHSHGHGPHGAHNPQRHLLKSSIAISSPSSIGGLSTPDSSKSNQDAYTKFHKLSSLCEKTEDGIISLETQLKELNMECKKFLEDCENSVLVKPPKAPPVSAAPDEEDQDDNL